MTRPMIFLILCGALGLALVGWSLYLLFYRSPVPASGIYSDYDRAQVTIDGTAFRTAVADTMASRAQGLSDRPSMAADEAMLFIFSVPYKYSFWMKDMHFPLDMVWVRNGVIVDISKDVPVPPDGASMTSLPTFTPQSAVDSVLEVNAGLAAKYGWKIGDAMRYNPITSK